MLIANAAVVLIYLSASGAMRQNYPSAPGWAFPILTLGGVLNIVFLVALFRWKKWGFWGSALTYAGSFFINLVVGLNVVQALLGLSGLAILYGVLHIGKENKGWSQLE
jgi:hypothetical protein